MSDILWSGPGKALNAHLELFEKIERTRRWVTSNLGRAVDLTAGPPLLAQRMLLVSSMGHNLKAVSSDAVAFDGYSPGLDRDDPNFREAQESFMRAASLLDAEYKMLNEGETHYVSHNVKEVVEAAAAQAADEPLFPTDLPCPSGLIVLEYPLVLNDLHPETGEVVEGLSMPTRAIGWREHEVYASNDSQDLYERKTGILYTCYTDADSYEAMHIPAVQKLLEKDPVRGPDYIDRAMGGGKILGTWATDFSGWAYGMDWHRAGDAHKREDFAKGEIHDNVAVVRRFLLAYFRWTWQRILVPQTWRPNRAQQRQSDRLRPMPQDGYVKVMRLRRHVEMEARGETIDESTWAYEHQWIVRRHPRRQHYPSLGPARNPDGSFNHDSHRRIWIEPYVKGNPDGPLIRGHNVTAAVR